MIWHIQDNTTQQSHQMREEGVGATVQGCWWSNPGVCNNLDMDTSGHTLPEEEAQVGGEEEEMEEAGDLKKKRKSIEINKRKSQLPDKSACQLVTSPGGSGS